MKDRDDLLGLREITIRFFEEGLSSLVVLRKEMDKFPDNPEARQRWLNEVHVFARRAQDLSEKWGRLFPKMKISEDSGADSEHPSHDDIPTPRV